MNDNILRVGIMCRVSTEEQALHGESLEAQETTLVEYANTHNMKIYKIYRDAGFSARKAVLKRPAMLELLEDVKANKLDMVIFTKLDRWFRNIKEYYKIQEILEQHNVTWRAILEDYNTATADGRLKVNIMLSVAENEADRTSERIKFVFQSKINKKEVIFNSKTTPFGYKVIEIDGARKLVKDEATQEVTEYFFNLAQTTSIRQAALMANQKYGEIREYKAWHRMCRNEIYIGQYKGIEGYCEPYLTPNQFAEVGKNKIARKAKNNRTYLFTGLVTCPYCGRKMTAKYMINAKKIEYYYYRCPNTIIEKCNVKTIAEPKIEKYVLKNIKDELEKFILEHEVAQPKAPKKKSDVTKLKEQLRRVNVSYQAGNMEDEEYLAETKKIKAMIEKATQEDNPEKQVDVSALKDFLNSGFEEIYDSLDKEEKQRLWRSVIDELIYDGKNIASIKFKA